MKQNVYDKMKSKKKHTFQIVHKQYDLNLKVNIHEHMNFDYF